MQRNGKNFLKSLICIGIFCVLFHTLRKIIPTIASEHHYFPPEFENKHQELNDRRVEKARKLFNRYKRNDERLFDYSITVVSSTRPNNYFIQVIGYLFGEYGNNKRPFIEVCNVERGIPEHLNEIKDYLSISNGTDLSFPPPTNFDQRLSKESRDFWECLRKTDRKSRYVIMFEDDAIVAKDFPIFIQSIVSQLDIFTHIDYVKLYHPQPLRKLPSLPQVLIVAGICAIIITSFIYGNTISRPFFIYFIFCFVVLGIWLRSFGAQFPADFRYFLTGSMYMSMPESCCTPATIFRSQKIDAFVDKLSKAQAMEGHAKDHILDESPFIGRMTDTNLVVHIGEYSITRQKDVYMSDSEKAKGFW